MSTAYEARYRAALGSFTRWTTVVEWSNDGGSTWQPATFVSGSVTCSATSQVRWTCSLQLRDVPYGFDGLNPYQSRLRVRHGMVLGRDEQPVMFGLGLYAVTAIERTTEQRDQVSVEASSFETYLMRSTFTKAKTFRGFSAEGLVARLILEVLPEASISWNPELDRYLALPTTIVESDRWGTIDGGSNSTSIAKALAARIYPDGDGIWRVEPVPNLQDDTPVWYADQGPGGVLLKQTQRLSSENVENVAIVQGTPSGGAIIGPVIAKDYDPLSLTYVGRGPDEGGFGEAPGEVYASALIVSSSQAQRVAKARLAARLGLSQTLSFDTLHDPTKQPGQVGVVSGFPPQRVILDSVTYDLSSTPAPLSCQTRTTATRYAGDIEDPTADPLANGGE